MTFRQPQMWEQSIILPQELGRWSVYLLKCRQGQLYCGISNQPNKRWQQHISGCGARYTRMNQPVAMRLVITQLTHSAAARCEYRIKRLSKAQKEMLWDMLINFQVQSLVDNMTYKG